MKIRLALAALIFGGAIVLAGCSSGEGASAASSSESPAATTSSASPAATETEEELDTVDVRIARSLLDQEGSLTDEEIVAGASEISMGAVVEGETVVYTMTVAQRNEMLANMRSSAREAADELIADETNSVTGVESNDAMTSITVFVDGARYSPIEALLALGFFVSGGVFQQVNGVANDDIDVIVEFVDDASGEVLDTASFQDMRENVEQ